MPPMTATTLSATLDTARMGIMYAMASMMRWSEVYSDAHWRAHTTRPTLNSAGSSMPVVTQMSMARRAVPQSPAPAVHAVCAVHAVRAVRAQ